RSVRFSESRQRSDAFRSLPHRERLQEMLRYSYRINVSGRRITLSVLLLALFAMPAAAQNVGRIAGTVTDAATGEPLPGANVLIVETTRGAAADADGSYYILNVPPGRYEVRASMVGYEPVT